MEPETSLDDALGVYGAFGVHDALGVHDARAGGLGWCPSVNYRIYPS